MRGKELYEKITDIDNDIIMSSADVAKTKKTIYLKWVAVAACLCLLIVAIPFLIQTAETPLINPGNDIMEGPPHIIVDSKKYFISSHMAVAEELPDGFEKAGIIDVVGGYENRNYYINPDIPEWVYVSHEVRTDGTVDSTGALTNTAPHNAYVRYVDERLRDKDLVYYNNEYYISMWSASYFGDNPDVSKEYYDKIETQYGIRIEGAAPNGFALAGTAEFTGDDTIPTGKLASNKEAAEVYYNPDASNVVLVATHWYTATAEENGETRHNGYDVYILYDFPLNKK